MRRAIIISCKEGLEVFFILCLGMQQPRTAMTHFQWERWRRLLNFKNGTLYFWSDSSSICWEVIQICVDGSTCLRGQNSEKADRKMTAAVTCGLYSSRKATSRNKNQQETAACYMHTSLYQTHCGGLISPYFINVVQVILQATLSFLQIQNPSTDSDPIH